MFRKAFNSSTVLSSVCSFGKDINFYYVLLTPFFTRITLFLNSQNLSDSRRRELFNIHRYPEEFEQVKSFVKLSLRRKDEENPRRKTTISAQSQFPYENMVLLSPPESYPIIINAHLAPFKSVLNQQPHKESRDLTKIKFYHFQRESNSVYTELEKFVAK